MLVFVVPFSMMAAPMSVSPEGSVTIPVTSSFCWAKATVLPMAISTMATDFLNCCMCVE